MASSYNSSQKIQHKMTNLTTSIKKWEAISTFYKMKKRLLMKSKDKCQATPQKKR